ncbi:MAG: hypothetical protein WC455_12395 [Dehalococcoidia bacterium]|jgi:hypothetical protein
MNHTETPWESKESSVVKDDKIIALVYSEDDDKHRWYWECGTANRDFIVHAVNQHDETIRILKIIEAEIPGWREVVAEIDDLAKSESLGKAMWVTLDQMDGALKFIHTLLAKEGL